MFLLLIPTPYSADRRSIIDLKMQQKAMDPTSCLRCFQCHELLCSVI